MYIGKDSSDSSGGTRRSAAANCSSADGIRRSFEISNRFVELVMIMVTKIVMLCTAMVKIESTSVPFVRTAAEHTERASRMGGHVLWQWSSSYNIRDPSHKTQQRTNAETI